MITAITRDGNNIKVGDTNPLPDILVLKDQTGELRVFYLHNIDAAGDCIFAETPAIACASVNTVF